MKIDLHPFLLYALLLYHISPFPILTSLFSIHLDSSQLFPKTRLFSNR